jgi:hypothetical protein
MEKGLFDNLFCGHIGVYQRQVTMWTKREDSRVAWEVRFPKDPYGARHRAFRSLRLRTDMIKEPEAGRRTAIPPFVYYRQSETLMCLDQEARTIDPMLVAALMDPTSSEPLPCLIAKLFGGYVHELICVRVVKIFILSRNVGFTTIVDVIFI